MGIRRAQINAISGRQTPKFPVSIYSLYDRSRKDLLIDGCTAQWWQGTTVSAQIGYSGNCKLFRSIHALVFRRCKVKFIMSERVNRRSN